MTRLSRIACVEFCVDIADRKKAEDALRRVIDQLELSNRELEQFAYISAHDLQEPLRQVRAYADLLHNRHADKLDGRPSGIWSSSTKARPA
jgi:light-regulated signal transduction histidine kinase (bacteriophytochrome)